MGVPYSLVNSVRGNKKKTGVPDYQEKKKKGGTGFRRLELEYCAMERHPHTVLRKL